MLRLARLLVVALAFVPLVLACGGGGGGGGGGEPDPLAPGADGLADFGTVTLDDRGLSPRLGLTVPASAFGFTIEVVPDVSGPGDFYGLAELAGPDGRIYFSTYADRATPERHWFTPRGAAGFVLPITDRPGMELVPGGGVYRFELLRTTGSTVGSLRVRARVHQGDPAAPGLVDLSVWIAAGQPFDAATAATNARMTQILSVSGAILGTRGLAVGAVVFRDVVDPAFDVVTIFPDDAELRALLSLSASAPRPGALNVFLVRALDDASAPPGTFTAGRAGTLGGPFGDGHDTSGVVVGDDGTRTAARIAQTLVHEIGHQLGLRHTAEQDGTHDLIGDTPDCPPTGTDALCPVEGGGLLMHWQGAALALVSPTQGSVLRAHGLVRYGGAAPKPLPAWVPTPEELHELLALPPVECRERPVHGPLPLLERR